MFPHTFLFFSFLLFIACLLLSFKNALLAILSTVIPQRLKQKKTFILNVVVAMQKGKTFMLNVVVAMRKGKNAKHSSNVGDVGSLFLN